jgi:hypothetical protein
VLPVTESDRIEHDRGDHDDLRLHCDHRRIDVDQRGCYEHDRRGHGRGDP